MKILITGVAGFIGFNLAQHLLKIDKKNKIIGIDILNNYYSVKIKKNRLKNLKNKNFSFFKNDICKKQKLEKIFKNHKPDLVINLAAQAGVRHSVDYPGKYIDANVLGYFNILDLCKKYKTKKLLYASSSSVYGDQAKFPTKEDSPLNAKNPYGVSKMMNENLASIYSNIYNLNFVGLRLFTVYGEWGRPDMFTFKLLNCIKKNKKFYLNKSGNHKRDLTYIKDVVNICTKLINYKADKKNEIFNICSSRSTNIKNLKEIFLKKYPNAKIVNAPANKADVKDTFGSNQKIKKAINYRKFTKFEIGIKNSIAWFKNNKIEKLIQ